ncbi:MAG: T9SS type A sorting domain-containing protein [Gelidibacter sp.]|nr:T9SS type A sorting domain-containing protein [Gelidibacter sp.]
MKSIAQYTKLYDFKYVNPSILGGRTPQGSLISDGTFLYGMTSLGGANGMGTIFKIMPDGSNFIKIFDFMGVVSGSEPIGSLYFDGTYLYGVTQKGGTSNFGTIFKILPDGTNYTKLKNFTGTPDGWRPKFCTLVSDGTYLYGTTIVGGSADKGAIFRIMPDGTNYSVIYSFTGGSGGENIYGSLILEGNQLYGMTELGGSNNLGTIFKVSTDGSNYVKLLDFGGGLYGGAPQGCSLYFDGGFLYGMTTYFGIYNRGIIFKIMIDGSGFTKLFDFDGAGFGGFPNGTLISHGTSLYGLTPDDGSFNAGTLFKINQDGTGFTTLFDFSANNGASPYGSLFKVGSFLYGMTRDGGLNGHGTIFKFQDISLSISDSELPNDFSVYPNPVNDILHIALNNNSILEKVCIYDTFGKLMKTESSNTISINNLTKGIYFLEVVTNQGKATKKIIKR